MKKIIFGFFVFASLFSIPYFLFPNQIQAACQRTHVNGSCPQGMIKCSGTKCCDTQLECATPAPTNQPISDPTCLDGKGINTAIGCIPVSDTNEFMGWILGWAVGVGGGIAFLLIVYASFMIMTSQGDPTRLKAGQELLTSAISGLIMLIFSIFILNFIGIDILGIFK